MNRENGARSQCRLNYNGACIDRCVSDHSDNDPEF